MEVKMVLQKILNIASEMSVGRAGKVSLKQKSFQYRKLSDIRSILKPLLIKNGLAYKPNAVRQGETLIFQCCFVDLESGDKECYEVPVDLDPHPGMSKEQASGAALTYAEKYLLSMIFMLDDGDTADPDSETNIKADETAAAAELKMLDAAKNEMVKAKTVEELYEIFNKFPTLKNNESLKKFGATLREKLSK